LLPLCSTGMWLSRAKGRIPLLQFSDLIINHCVVATYGLFFILLARNQRFLLLLESSWLVCYSPACPVLSHHFSSPSPWRSQQGVTVGLRLPKNYRKFPTSASADNLQAVRIQLAYDYLCIIWNSVRPIKGFGSSPIVRNSVVRFQLAHPSGCAWQISVQFKVSEWNACADASAGNFTALAATEKQQRPSILSTGGVSSFSNLLVALAFTFSSKLFSPYLNCYYYWLFYV
jgi:hypothetical protein